MTKPRLVKDTTEASVGAAAPEELPLIERAPEPKSTKKVGILSPNMFAIPTHEQLVGILMIFGIQTRAFSGQDGLGNLVDELGNVIIPQSLRPFFQIADVVQP